MSSQFFNHVDKILNSEIRVGIDYSMNSPGIALVAREEKIQVKLFGIKSIKGQNSYYILENEKYKVEIFLEDSQKITGIQRIINNYKYTINIIPDSYAAINIEGYSYGSTGRSILDIAENVGALKLKMHERGMLFNLIAPRELKKRVTGKGNCDKKAMVDAFYQKTGIDLLSVFPNYKAPITDLVDAYWLADFIV